MSKIIGIDLGTTNSCVSVLQGGVPRIIANAEGNRTTPSVVAFKDGRRIVGESAKRQAVTNPNTVFSIKSKMGMNHKVELEGKKYTPQEISAMILQTLKLQAEEYLGEEVSKAVITVPAYFDDAQRQATKDAGRIAGFEVERIINEPTAAALAYGLDKSLEEQTILVFDLGGGTLDVSVLEIDHGLFEVRATAGDNSLGGDNFDKVIVNHLLSEIKTNYGIDLRDDLVVMGRLREAAEAAKVELSAQTITTVSLPYLSTLAGAPFHFEYELTREKFESLSSHLIDRIIIPIKQAMLDAGLESKDIDKVILVGGSTRIPFIVDLVRKQTGHEPYKGVNPDEVVAMGAAIQGGILTGEVGDLILLDVTPLSLGIQVAGGLVSTIIPRNTTIPTSRSQIFSTAKDNQDSVSVHVLQGERPLASDNKTLGEFKLTGIAPAKSGVPRIEVTFSIDQNGIASVSARDLRTGKSQAITVQAKSGLSDDDVTRMVKEAAAYAKEDAIKAQEIVLETRAIHALQAAREALINCNNISKVEEVKKLNLLIEYIESSISNKDFSNIDLSILNLNDVVSSLEED